MTDIIDAADLASWLRDDSLASNTSLIQIVDLTNELVAEEWADPADPAPARIRLLALNVATRAWVADPSKSHLESLTRTLDDASRTEKFKSSGSGGSVYLTGDELAILQGRPQARSVRLVAYGEYGS